MAFKTINRQERVYDSPQELFSDLNRGGKVKSLWSHQDKALLRYMEEGLEKKDVSISLPTGSGKTLVGLLIAEYYRRKANTRVLYVCPTNQLVHQVTDQATIEYGIKAIAFTGQKSTYNKAEVAEFNQGKAIGITSYASVFNVSPGIKEADILIFDDVHSAEQTISSLWSITIDRTNHLQLFSQLLLNFDGVVSESSLSKLRSESNDYGENTFIDLAPFPFVHQKRNEISSIISSHVNEHTDLKFSWRMIQDHLSICNIFLSYNKILIRPFIPPTQTHDLFNKVQKRIYLSATTSETGDLERTVGVSDITYIKAPDDLQKSGIGKRFCVFPELMNIPEIDSDLKSTIVEIIRHSNRAVLIAPSDSEANSYEEFLKNFNDIQIFSKNSEITKSDEDNHSDFIDSLKKEFVQSEKAALILSNRIDGIDFSDDECRILIIADINKASHLQEKFLMQKLGSYVIYSEKIRSKIIQALGRCTRNASDRSIVFLLGENLLRETTTKQNLSLYPAQLQAELNYGYDQSINCESKEDLFENISHVINNSEEWRSAQDDINAQRDSLEKERLECFDLLQNSANLEVKIQYLLWKNDYEEASTKIDKLIEILNKDTRLKGYKSFWLYQAGNIAYLRNQQAAMKMFYNDTAKTAPGILWFNELRKIYQNEASQEETISSQLNHLIVGIEQVIKKYGIASKTKAFYSLQKKILDYLDSSNSKTFEEGHRLLGEFIGFQSFNDSSKVAPDPYWILGDDLCIVFEDYITEKEGTPLRMEKVDQANRHKLWIKNNIKALRETHHCISVILTNCETIESEMKFNCDGIYYWNIDDFTTWAKKNISIVTDLRQEYLKSEIDWRDIALEKLTAEKLTPSDIVKKIEEKKLSDIKEANQPVNV